MGGSRNQTDKSAVLSARRYARHGMMMAPECVVVANWPDFFELAGALDLPLCLLPRRSSAIARRNQTGARNGGMDQEETRAGRLNLERLRIGVSLALV